MRIKADIRVVENRKPIEKISKTKSCFFENMNKIDKCLARLRKKREHKLLISEMKEGTSLYIPWTLKDHQGMLWTTLCP